MTFNYWNLLYKNNNNNPFYYSYKIITMCCYISNLTFLSDKFDNHNRRFPGYHKRHLIYVFFIASVRSFPRHSHLKCNRVNTHQKRKKKRVKKSVTAARRKNEAVDRKSRCANYYHHYYHSIIIIAARPSHCSGRACAPDMRTARAVTVSILSHAGGRHIFRVCIHTYERRVANGLLFNRKNSSSNSSFLPRRA